MNAIALEPSFVATYRAHLIDEAGHVRCDEELLAHCWPKMGALQRRANAMLLAWLLGELRAGINPKRIAAMTMQTVMFIAQSSGGPDEATVHPITADEVWDFCSHGFVGS